MITLEVFHNLIFLSGFTFCLHLSHVHRLSASKVVLFVYDDKQSYRLESDPGISKDNTMNGSKLTV